MRRLQIVSLTLMTVTWGSSVSAAPRKKAAAPVPGNPTALPAEITGLTLEPGAITLDGARSQQHLVVTGTTKDGATYDLTEQVRFSLANPKLGKLAHGVLTPAADGVTRLSASLGKLTSAPVEVTVKNSAAPAALEFVNDVMPILAKSGCNSTNCHGSPVGKGGFKLSLFGYEPAEDFKAIAQDQNGKRVNAKAPEQSLLLQKAAMGVPHAGGQRFTKDSREYKTLLAWLKEGAPGIGEFEARVKQVQVLPEQPWMPQPNATQRLAVLAHMTDGTVQDVTDRALFSSNDDAVAEVNDGGKVTAKRPGETAVMVRYLGQMAISRIAVLPNWKLPPTKETPANYIDAAVQAKLQKLRTAQAPVCTDSEFVRRVYLDVCGIAPTAEEAKAFLADTDPAKRNKLIDQLLERPEFTDLWTLKWNDTLRNNPLQTRIGMGSYFKWIREQLASNRPYDQWVSELITASGKNTDIMLTEESLPPQLQNVPNKQFVLTRANSGTFNAAANYFAVSKDPLDVTSATSQIFLGVRIECARCHNHPFEKWTQRDFYGLASFFSNLSVRGGQVVFPTLVANNPFASPLRDPKTNEPVEPKLLDDADVKVNRGVDKRAVLARWMTWPDNPYFAKSLVNRLWGYYFSRGIVEPVDDFRTTNPASNPALLDALATDFVESKFDLKHMHRAILNSRTYQASSVPNQYNRHDATNFARYYPKRLMAEQLYDSISQATGIFLPPGAGGARRRPFFQANTAQNVIQRSVQSALPEGGVQRVMQLPTPRAPGPAGTFLDTFGKPRREVVCECERSPDGNIGQALALINGVEVNGKIAAPFGRVARAVRSGAPEAAVVEELYLAALSRRPSAEEVAEASSLLRSASTRQEGAEDLMWSLLNSREFLFIH